MESTHSDKELRLLNLMRYLYGELNLDAKSMSLTKKVNEYNLPSPNVIAIKLVELGYLIKTGSSMNVKYLWNKEYSPSLDAASKIMKEVSDYFKKSSVETYITGNDKKSDTSNETPKRKYNKKSDIGIEIPKRKYNKKTNLTTADNQKSNLSDASEINKLDDVVKETNLTTTDNQKSNPLDDVVKNDKIPFPYDSIDKIVEYCRQKGMKFSMTICEK